MRGVDQTKRETLTFSNVRAAALLVTGCVKRRGLKSEPEREASDVFHVPRSARVVCATQNKGSRVYIIRRRAKPSLCERLPDDHQLLAQPLRRRRQQLLLALHHRDSDKVRISEIDSWKTVQIFTADAEISLFFFFVAP